MASQVVFVRVALLVMAVRNVQPVLIRQRGAQNVQMDMSEKRVIRSALK